MRATIARSGKSVELRGVEKRFGEVVAVTDVTLAIEAGEFCTLLGPSGSGKTTLLKVVAGFEAPDRGTVAIGGHPMTDVKVAKRNIGMVFQNYALFPHMTVRANVAFPLEMRYRDRREAARLVADALELVDLKGFERRFPRELSGGQQQRVALARALVFSPDILLMDEPLGALDKNLRQTIQLELKALHRKVGVTIVYVTHDQEEALFLSDRVVVMRDGRIVQVGAPEALYERPASCFVARFLGDCNLVPATVAGIEGGGITVVVESGEQVTLAGDAAVATGVPVMLACRPENVGITAAPGGNRLAATVEDVIFLGGSRKFVLRHGRRTLTAVVTGRDGLARVNAGSPVFATFPATDSFLLPAE